MATWSCTRTAGRRSVRPGIERSVEDLQRWAVMVKAGYTWAGSSLRQGGVEVRAAAEDTERLRRIFVQHVGHPQAHDSAWPVVGRERRGQGGRDVQRGRARDRGPYDALLLTSGVLAGGSRAYDMRLDLRVVYQYLCGNHPQPDETPYPVDRTASGREARRRRSWAARADECLGLKRAGRESAPSSSSASCKGPSSTWFEFPNVFDPQPSELGHLGTFRTSFSTAPVGASPFGNMGVRYTGCD